MSGMTILFNNDSENLIHNYLDHTTSSTLAQQITHVTHNFSPGSLTGAALSRAVGSWSAAIAQSNAATAEQLQSVAAMLTRLRNDDDGLAAQLGRIL